MQRFIALTFLCFYVNANGCELNVGIREVPPYSYKDSSMQWQGLDIELFQQIAKKTHCRLTFIEVAFGQGLRLLMDGKIDAMSQLSKLPERKEKIYFVGPIRMENFSLVTSKDVKEEIEKLTDISSLPYLFAKRESTYLGNEFESLYKKDHVFASKFIEMNSKERRINLVLKNRIEGYFDEEKYVQYAFETIPLYQNMKLHPLKISSGDVYLGFNKSNFTTLQIEKITQVVTQLR